MSERPRLTPLLLVGFFLLLLVGATLLLAFTLFSAPRSTFVLAAIGFICWLELLFGMMIGLSLVKGEGEGGPSVAMNAILFKVASLYGIVGVITIVAFAFMPESTGRDNIFGATLFLESVLFFIIGATLCYNDIRFQAKDAPVLAQREQHAVKSFSLQSVLMTMRGIRMEQPDLLSRCDALMKKLEKAEQALAHSHGGGLAGGIPDPKAFEAQISQAVDGLTDGSSTLAGDNADAAAETLGQMEQHANQLQAALAGARLL